MWVDLKEEQLEGDVVTFGAVMSAMNKGSQWDKSLETLNQMERSQLEGNLITCSSAISACEKGGKWQLALLLLDAIDGDGMQPSVLARKQNSGRQL